MFECGQALIEGGKAGAEVPRLAFEAGDARGVNLRGRVVLGLPEIEDGGGEAEEADGGEDRQRVARGMGGGEWGEG